MHHISRRKFVGLAAAGVATSSLAQVARSSSGAITAQAIVDRIKQNVGGEWKPDTADTFKTGDPFTRITGIATTSLASLDALNRAVNAGANLIITSEPTFFAKADTPTPPARRPPGQTGAQPSTPPPPSPPDPVPVSPRQRSGCCTAPASRQIRRRHQRTTPNESGAIA